MIVREYVGYAGVGQWFGVPGTTVSKWIGRYAETHPCPKPDATIDGRPGWLPGSESAWRTWEASRPGRGAGGGRPRRQPVDNPRVSA